MKKLPLPVLGVVGILVLVGALFGAGQMGLPVPIFGKAEVAPSGEAMLPRFTLKERIIDLLPEGKQKSYVKITVAFEYSGKKVPDLSKLKGSERIKVQTELNKELEYEIPALQGALTDVLATKRAAELQQPAGLVKLQAEIMEAFNGVLGHEFQVRHVFLTDKVVQ